MKPHPSSVADLAVAALSELDVGVVLLDAESMGVLYANRAGQRALVDLKGFAEPSGTLRKLLASFLDPEPKERQPAGASTIVAESGTRYTARWRSLEREGVRSVLLILSDLSLRSERTREALRRRYGLTPVEARIAFLVASGAGNRDIAGALRIAEGTVKNHLTHVFTAMSVRSRAALAAMVHEISMEPYDSGWMS